MGRKASNPFKHQEYHYSVPFPFDPEKIDKGASDYEEIVGLVYGRIKQLVQGIEFSAFKLGASWWDMDEELLQKLKVSVQHRLIEEISQNLRKTPDFSYFDADFLVDFAKKAVFLRLSPVFVRGKYCKFSREIAQTEFYCNRCGGRGCWYCKNTGHFCDESVEQLIGQVMAPHFKAKVMVMHGAGREDMDVLMLGKGRPFIAELVRPELRHADLKAIEEEINEKYGGKISVNTLELAALKDVAPLKDSPHDKIYSAIVSCASEPDLAKLQLGQKIEVSQFTPQRVMKRRGNIERKKEVVLLKAEKSAGEPKEFAVEIRTSHGAYIKEFISGDSERTKPSLSSLLGVHCSCKQLDVLEICE